MLEIIVALCIITGLSIVSIMAMDWLCFLFWYNFRLSNDDIRKWNYGYFGIMSREFFIITKGFWRTEISTRYEHLIVPTIWIYRFSELSIKKLPIHLDESKLRSKKIE